MNRKHLIAAILALSVSAGASEIPPVLEAAPKTAQAPGLDAVELREFERLGPGPQAGRPLSQDERSWVIVGIALLAVILVATV